MSRGKDLTGMRFGHLTVISEAECARRSNGKPRRKWNCICDCGKSVVVFGENLARGNTKSCGCFKAEIISEKLTTHGDTDSRLYNVWCAIKRRCYNSHVQEYYRYGGRGIRMCEEWRLSYESFKEWAMKNGYDPCAKRGECTIDRIDNDGNYEPENCRWVTQRDQMNNVSYNRVFTYRGETHTIAEFSRMYNIPYSRLQQRLTIYGYDIEKALNTD